MEGLLSRSPSEEPAVYDPRSQLEHDRRANDLRLKSRFERIFDKYTRDFTEVGDEIDLVTGDVVVDNGHLSSMQHEQDTGRSASSQFVRAFAEGLEKEDGVDSEDSDELDAENDSQDGSSAIGSLEDETITDVPGGVSAFGRGRDLEVDTATNEDGLVSFDGTSAEISSGHQARTDVLDQIPALTDTMAALKKKSKSGQTIDPDAIQALGQSIATQIAQFLSKATGHTSKAKPKSKWDFPELPRQKRKRVESPVSIEPPLSPEVPYGHSPPGQESIWAPAKVRRASGPRKRRRIAFDEAKVAAGGPPINNTRYDHARGDDELVAEQIANEMAGVMTPRTPEPSVWQEDLERCCENCGTTKTSLWRISPQWSGELCNSCAQHWYSHHAMRPVQSLLEDDMTFEDGGLGESGRHATGYTANTARKIGLGLNPRYTKEDNAKLIRLKEVESLPWDKIRDAFPGRSFSSLQSHYSRNLGPKVRQDSILHLSTEENELLAKLRKDGLDWDAIADYFPRRTAYSLRRHYAYRDYPLAADVELLRDTIDYTPRGKKAPKRDAILSTRSQRDAAVAEGTAKVHVLYTDEEDVLLTKLREDGLSWEDIAERMPTRTVSSLYCRYHQKILPRKSRTLVRDSDSDDDDEAEPGPQPKRPCPGSEADAEDESDDTVVVTEKPRPERFGMKFTEEEDELIIKMREVDCLRWTEIAARLGGRTKTSVSSRYLQQILPRKHPEMLEQYTTGRISPLRGSLPEEPMLSQSEPSRYNRYTVEEVELITSLWKSGASWRDLVNLLPGRTEDSLKWKIRQLNDGSKKRMSLPETLRSTSAQRMETPLLRQALDNRLKIKSTAVAPSNYYNTIAIPMITSANGTAGQGPTNEHHKSWEPELRGAHDKWAPVENLSGSQAEPLRASKQLHNELNLNAHPDPAERMPSEEHDASPESPCVRSASRASIQARGHPYHAVRNSLTPFSDMKRLDNGITNSNDHRIVDLPGQVPVFWEWKRQQEASLEAKERAKQQQSGSNMPDEMLDPALREVAYTNGQANSELVAGSPAEVQIPHPRSPGLRPADVVGYFTPGRNIERIGPHCAAPVAHMYDPPAVSNSSQAVDALALERQQTDIVDDSGPSTDGNAEKDCGNARIGAVTLEDSRPNSRENWSRPNPYYNDEETKHRKPPHSMFDLVMLAFNASNGREMQAREVCEYVANNFAYYRWRDNNWRGSVSSRLSTDPAFVNVGPNKRKAIWALAKSAQEPKGKTFATDNEPALPEEPIMITSSRSASVESAPSPSPAQEDAEMVSPRIMIDLTSDKDDAVPGEDDAQGEKDDESAQSLDDPSIDMDDADPGPAPPELPSANVAQLGKDSAQPPDELSVDLTEEALVPARKLPSQAAAHAGKEDDSALPPDELSIDLNDMTTLSAPEQPAGHPERLQSAEDEQYFDALAAPESITTIVPASSSPFPKKKSLPPITYTKYSTPKQGTPALSKRILPTRSSKMKAPAPTDSIATSRPKRLSMPTSKAKALTQSQMTRAGSVRIGGSRRITLPSLGSSRRVVQTPARELADSEDELA